jgi:threonine dehydrogenase-like Zn-dependent dehydrogenase
MREAGRVVVLLPPCCARRRVPGAGREVCGEDGFDAVAVASGRPSCLDEAPALVRPRGTVVLAGVQTAFAELVRGAESMKLLVDPAR